MDALKGQTEPIEGFNMNVASTVFSDISRVAAMKGASVTDDEQGQLLITRTGTAKASTAIRSGPNGNILAGSGDFDIFGRYRNYVSTGQEWKRQGLSSWPFLPLTQEFDFTPIYCTIYGTAQ